METDFPSYAAKGIRMNTPRRTCFLRCSLVVLGAVLLDRSCGTSGAENTQQQVERRAALTGRVVRTIVQTAQGNSEAGAGQRLRGDQLTNRYIRAAAKAANDLPKAHGPRVFLAAIGVAIDDSDLLLANPLTRHICQQIEPPDERARRLKVLGAPTMRGRHDLAQHFAVSAFLTAEMGGVVAEAAGLAKELLDAQAGGGFSFADLAADRAGIRFAERVAAGDFELRDLARGFLVQDYMPAVDGLPEGIRALALEDEYGGTAGERFQALVVEIDNRIRSLPCYRAVSGTDK